MRVFRYASVILLITLFAIAARGSDLKVTRSLIEPAAVLPAAPVWISFAVRNASDRPASFPERYVVLVMPESGEPFIARRLTSTVGSLPGEYGALDLAPDEMRQIDFPTGSTIGDGLFADERFWNPGVYVIRLIFSDDLTDDRVERTAATQLVTADWFASPPLVAL